MARAIEKLTWRAGSDARRVVALAEKTVDATDGELEARLGRARLSLRVRAVAGRLAAGLCACVAGGWTPEFRWVGSV